MSFRPFLSFSSLWNLTSVGEKNCIIPTFRRSSFSRLASFSIYTSAIYLQIVKKLSKCRFNDNSLTLYISFWVKAANHTFPKFFVNIIYGISFCIDGFGICLSFSVWQQLFSQKILESNSKELQLLSAYRDNEFYVLNLVFKMC